MKEIIIKKLGIDNKTYKDVRSHKYSEWCKKTALHHGLAHRSLVMNETLYNWFKTQYVNYVEMPFVNDIQCYMNIDDPDLFQNLFYAYIDEVLECYPGALLKKLKLQQDFKNNIKQSKN